MRIFVLICVAVAVVLTLWAAFWIVDAAILNRTDREALIGAFFLLCLATPFALIAGALGLMNRHRYPRWQFLGSLGAFTVLLLTAIFWTIVNY